MFVYYPSKIAIGRFLDKSSKPVNAKDRRKLGSANAYVVLSLAGD